MTAADIIFYLLGSMTLLFGILAVSSRQLFRSAIYLLFSLISIAGLYFWMEYEFVAAVQIVVYVGGIVVLIIFSILLTQEAGEKLPRQRLTRKVSSIAAVVFGFAIIMLQVMRTKFIPTEELPLQADVRTIGKQLLDVDTNGMALPFEVITFLLLAAMIGCIVIAMRDKENVST
jgi:NADH-quinone oxidoreductase subunit J